MHSRVNFLGVHVSAVNMDQVRDSVTDWLLRREPHYVCVTSAHLVMDCRRDPQLRRSLNGSGLTAPDGMSMVWLLKLHGYRDVNRVYGADLMLEVCRISEEKKWRHFFYGGAPDVAEELVGRLQTRFPNLQVAGVYSPPYRPLTASEERTVVDHIKSSRADIIWVGMSSPRQVAWMAEHDGKLNASVLIGVGAAFDFLSGRKRQAPRWVQRSGMEWLFRLTTEPWRLWRRYAQYPLFAVLILLQAIGLTRYD